MIIDGKEETVKERSVGRVVPNIEIKVINEEGKEVPPGEIGEILYRGPNVMQGYYGDSEKTAEAIDKEGWLHSGDLGSYKDGELFGFKKPRSVVFADQLPVNAIGKVMRATIPEQFGKP